ncbi:MAG: DNA alkylation repair protein [Chloroflexota bacterium]|nr:DNA alkylation repair protein [Chloroflexota bacterium]
MRGPVQPDSLGARLEAVATPERSAGEARYLKLTDRRVIGTGMKPWERVAAGYLREWGRPDLEQLARWFDASLEEAWTAIYCLSARPEFDAASWLLVDRWSGAPDTWAIADPLARILVAGHLEAGAVNADVLRAWAARDEPFWFRRIALVATTSLNGGLGAPTRTRLRRFGRVPEIGVRPRPALTIDLLEASIHDRTHFVRLGIGWTLRELSAVDPDEAAAFVQRHRRQFTKAMLAKARLDDHGRRTT